MSRLTEKKFLANFKTIKNLSPNYVASKEELMYEKLGKLEDLEEEIGCPLEVVLKALKEGIIIDRELPKYKVIIGFEENELCLYIEQKFPKWKYKLKDYKKTWWLKEVLE